MRYGGSRVVVMAIPGYLDEPRIEAGLEQEELREAVGHRRINRPAAQER